METIPLPRKYNIMIVGIWALLMIASAGFFMFKYYGMQEVLRQVRARKISGYIVQLKDIERGSYHIEIDDSLTHSKVDFDLPVSEYVKEHNIHVSDFASKDSNSEILTIYHVDMGQFKKCCELSVSF